MRSEDIEQRASLYANRYGLTLDDRLGFGADGTVFKSNRQSAVVEQPRLH